MVLFFCPIFNYIDIGAKISVELRHSDWFIISNQFVSKISESPINNGEFSKYENKINQKKTNEHTTQKIRRKRNSRSWLA